MRFIAFILLFFSFNSFAYNRSDYGVWADLDKNCKSTRIDILTTQALSISKSSCTNIDGTWKDFYSEKIITNDSIIDIDHVIPLAYADKNGANKWSHEKKVRFANDPINLVITHRSINRQKGSKGLSNWLPINYTIRCDYFFKWYQISNQYNLTLEPNDAKILERNKQICPNFNR